MSTVTGVRDAAGVMGCHGKEDMWRHSGADLRALIPAAVTLMQQLQSLVAAGLAEVDTRGIVGSWGYTSTAAWLSNSTPLSHMEASRFARACSTLIRHGEVGEAFAANRFAGSHADIIARFLDDRKHIEKLAAHPEMVAAMMDVLVIDAADNDSRNLRNTVAAFTEQLADIDTDPGALPDAENVDLDEVHASVVDGRLVLRGDLNCLDAERVMNIITALSKPVPQPDGSPDPRSAGQRRADAVKQVFAWFAAHADELPSQGGRKAILDLHMNVDDFYPDPAHAAAAKAAAVADFDPAAAAVYANAAAQQMNRNLADLVDNPRHHHTHRAGGLRRDQQRRRGHPHPQRCRGHDMDRCGVQRHRATPRV